MPMRYYTHPAIYMDKTMRHLLSKEDSIFKTQFETCEFPVSDFEHQSHLRLAYIYLIDNTIETAIPMMRESLNRFIQHNGVSASKYHETLTQAWLLAVHHFMQKTERAESSLSFIDQNPEMLDTDIMLTHYTPDVLFSEEARQTFIQPDIETIPQYGA
ncbi:actinorhodin polyketide dimerase [Elysia marginata]|uniref:Actinorhodin polyketide dimerase n=1 Tax=Elysia marginata TaxID=1093978 RepID=A0AAV4JQ84_9GAST|nr:actinorhodin polyketide dimerase [Elysia marginata]